MYAPSDAPNDSITGLQRSHFWSGGDDLAGAFHAECAGCADGIRARVPVLPLPRIDVHEVDGRACDAGERLAGAWCVDRDIDTTGISGPPYSSMRIARMLSSTPLGRCRASCGGNSDPSLHQPACGSAHAYFPDDPLVLLPYGFSPHAEDSRRMAEPNPVVRG